jgi:hypothetical protein
LNLPLAPGVMWKAAVKSHDQAILDLHPAFVRCCMDMQPDNELVRA